jgi:hypothetical protein
LVTACQTLDRVAVTFDDDRSVANAGLLLPASLAARFGLEDAADELVVFAGDRAGAGAKVLTVVHSMLAGGDYIDDIDVLRSGSTASVLGHRVLAPSTIGSWLRRFDFGHIRQLDRLAEHALTAAWAAGLGPGAQSLTIDIDSTICEAHGYAKQGASFGYTRVRGFHPLLATRADTGEILHVRFRKGSANTGRGAERFVREVVGRVRRAGATGPMVLRADSGFWSKHVIKACRDHGIGYSITVRNQKPIVAVTDAIAEKAWVDIDYTAAGRAQVAETTYGDGHRLIVRRTRLVGRQAELFPTWRHHSFITDRTGTAVALDEDHRAHAVVELAVRELKAEGLAHCPSGQFHANGAWAVLAALAHNMARWVHALGTTTTGPMVTKTLRRRLLAIAGRITTTARQRTLHLPTGWPWAARFTATLDAIRAIGTG